VAAERVDPRILRTREAVLQATLALAGERGFGGLTIEEIAHRANVAPSTIYRHWNGLSEIVRDAVEVEIQIDIEVPDTGSIRDDLVFIMLEWARVVRGDRYGAVAPHLVSAAALDADIREVMIRVGREREAAELAVLDRGVSRGELPKYLDTNRALELLTAPIFWRAYGGYESIDDEWVVKHVDLVLELIKKWPDQVR
jgi:AcrR family transcriptional regulator